MLEALGGGVKLQRYSRGISRMLAVVLEDNELSVETAVASSGLLQGESRFLSVRGSVRYQRPQTTVATAAYRIIGWTKKLVSESFFKKARYRKGMKELNTDQEKISETKTKVNKILFL